MSFDIGQTHSRYDSVRTFRFRPMSFDIGQTPQVYIGVNPKWFRPMSFDIGQTPLYSNLYSNDIDC